MRDTALDARLRSAAGFVRQGAVFADIGTDHAHLPIFLLKAGVISRAVCSDINEGPLSAAGRNLAECGFSERAELVLTDGAGELAGRGITDYAICGMGGELIVSIISAAPQLFDTGVHLILQPMTRQATLRTELYRMGFSIIREKYSYADGRYYVTMLAVYTGEKREISESCAEIGLSPVSDEGRVEYIGYLEAKLASLERAIDGRRRGGGDVSRELLLAEEIRDAIERTRESVK